MVKPKAPTPREQQLAVLAALPGVGPVLAARLLDHFGGLRGVLGADAAALAAVPGVGDAIAAASGPPAPRRCRGSGAVRAAGRQRTCTAAPAMGG